MKDLLTLEPRDLSHESACFLPHDGCNFAIATKCSPRLAAHGGAAPDAFVSISTRLSGV
jgi:hypothetical protein